MTNLATDKFFCKRCKQLSDDGEPWNDLCMGCADELADMDKEYDIDDQAAN